MLKLCSNLRVYVRGWTVIGNRRFQGLTVIPVYCMYWQASLGNYFASKTERTKMSETSTLKPVSTITEKQIPHHI
jgi:hypothetical protein